MASRTEKRYNISLTFIVTPPANHPDIFWNFTLDPLELVLQNVKGQDAGK